MQTNLTRTAAVLGVLTLGSLYGMQAQAGCSPADLPRATKSSFNFDNSLAPRLGDYQLVRTSNHEPDHYGPFTDSPIVGMWSFVFAAAGAPPDAKPVDQGFVTWHSDGTELMNSGRPPMTGSFCMGVWKQVGNSTFMLNHWALSWDDTGTVFIGPTNIRERVTVDRSGKHYSGSFTLTQYTPDGKNAVGGVSGSVTATRVTVD